MNDSQLEPLRRPMLEGLPLPWRACRSHEDHEGPLWEIDPEDAVHYAGQPFLKYAGQPFVRIVASNGQAVVSNSDLFEFRDPAVAHLLVAAPALLRALEELLRVDDAWHGSVNSEMAAARRAARAALLAARGGA